MWHENSVIFTWFKHGNLFFPEQNFSQFCLDPQRVFGQKFSLKFININNYSGGKIRKFAT